MSRFTTFFTITLLIGIVENSNGRIIRIPEDWATIQAGIDSSEAGDTVLVSRGLYRENIVIQGHAVVVGSAYLMNGDSLEADSTIIDPIEGGSVVTFGEGCGASVLAGITIRNGTGTWIADEWGNADVYGGGIFAIWGEPVIDHCIVRDNRLENWLCSGGGIYARKVRISIWNCVISNNEIVTEDGRFGNGGGIYLDSSVSVIESCKITNNDYDGIYTWKGSATFRNNVINGNTECGLSLRYTPSVISKCIISNNLQGMYAITYRYREEYTIDSCEVFGNAGDQYVPGGIYLDNALVTISNSYIHNNGNNGLTARYTKLTMENCHIKANRGHQGAGLALSCCDRQYDAETAKITNCVFYGNRNDGGYRPGGGIYSYASSVWIDRSVFSYNTASSGGGIWINDGTGIIVNSTFINNSGSASKEIDCEESDLTLINSIVWNTTNRAVLRHTSGRSPTSIAIANSCIKGGVDSVLIVNNSNFSWLAGNISTDPQMLSSREVLVGQLRDNSPCIDAGRQRFVWLGDTLFDYAENEFYGDAPDIGYYETNFNGVKDTPIAPFSPTLITAFPNPFNSTTLMTFNLPIAGQTSLKVFDLTGRIVATLVDDWRERGNYRVQWDAGEVPGGIYLAKLEAGEVTTTCALMLEK